MASLSAPHGSSVACHGLQGHTFLPRVKFCTPNAYNSAKFFNGILKNSSIGIKRVKGVDRTRVAVLSGDGDLLSYPNTNGAAGQNSFVDELPTVHINSDSISFGTLAAEINSTTRSFVSQEDEYDMDRPTEGFNSIPEAVEDIRQGKLVIVVDDEDRENEGDLIMAGSLVTPEAMAFIVKHGTGIVCVSMKEEDLERLQLPLMVPQKENEEKLSTAFMVSVVGILTKRSLGASSGALFLYTKMK